MQKYFDNINNRLVFTKRKADADFWDSHWSKNDIKKLYSKYKSPFDYVLNTTKKYIKPKGILLEGGCGLGQQVFKLHNASYKIIGIDYAQKTVTAVKKVRPELDIRLDDVRKLSFEDNYFDGYWSFGVIEHFYNGYDEIFAEMQRVIKPGGYLFLTFPHLSKLRKLKGKKGKYPNWENRQKDIERFYQFALDEKRVIGDLEKINFTLVEQQYLSGIKGLKDEVDFVRKPLQRIFDKKSFITIIISKIISFIFNKFSSHSILLVLKKRNLV